MSWFWIYVLSSVVISLLLISLAYEEQKFLTVTDIGLGIVMGFIPLLNIIVFISFAVETLGKYKDNIIFDGRKKKR